MRVLIEKNILDLQHQKALQFFILTLMAFITYTISVLVYLLTNNFNVDKVALVVLIFFSGFMFTLCGFSAFYFLARLNRVVESLRGLR